GVRAHLLRLESEPGRSRDTPNCTRLDGSEEDRKKRARRVLLPPGEGGPKGRMRARFCPHPPLRGTLSRRERKSDNIEATYSARLWRFHISHPVFERSTHSASCSRSSTTGTGRTRTGAGTRAATGKNTAAGETGTDREAVRDSEHSIHRPQNHYELLA